MSVDIWADIPKYEGVYQVSNKGKVRSLDRKIVHKTGATHLMKGRVLKEIMLGKYLGVQLSLLGKIEKAYTHRLVALNFIENTHKKGTVNHKDGNKFNNHFTNLEWMTIQENIQHANETGLIKLKGENNPMCKFSDATVREVRKLAKSGEYKQIEIARMFQMSPMQVSRIVRRILRKGA